MPTSFDVPAEHWHHLRTARQALAISGAGYILDIGTVALKGPARARLHDERAASLYVGKACA